MLQGADFVEHWPVSKNFLIPHEVFRSSLGVFEFNQFNEIELLKTKRKRREDDGMTAADYAATL